VKAGTRQRGALSVRRRGGEKLPHGWPELVGAGEEGKTFYRGEGGDGRRTRSPGRRATATWGAVRCARPPLAPGYGVGTAGGKGVILCACQQACNVVEWNFDLCASWLCLGGFALVDAGRRPGPNAPSSPSPPMHPLRT
jgi:hypothetical protein